LWRALKADRYADAGDRKIFEILDAVLQIACLDHCAGLNLTAEQRRYGRIAVRGEAGLRASLEHHTEIEVEVHTGARDVPVPDAKVRGSGVAGLHRAAQAADRSSWIGRATDREGATRRLRGDIDLVGVQDESASDAKRPERTPVEEQVPVRQLWFCVVLDVARLDRRAEGQVRIPDARGQRRHEPPRH